jgi:hypothetical protein
MVSKDDPYDDLPTNELAEAVKALCKDWFTATGRPWPPNMTHFYAFSEFCDWWREKDRADAAVLDDPKAREIIEIYFQVGSRGGPILATIRPQALNPKNSFRVALRSFPRETDEPSQFPL